MPFSYKSWRYPAITKIFIEKSMQATPFVQNTLANIQKIDLYNNVQIEFIENADELLAQYRSKDNRLYRDHLLIHHKKTNFFEKCPGSDGALCCHYFIIDAGLNCPYDCSYCFLQSYMSHSLTTLYANTDELFENLHKQIHSNEKVHWRIGTGEYSDSLAYDYLTEFSPMLVDFFSQQKNATLELKTKSDNIGNLLQIPNPRNTVISWSLNPPALVQEIEKGTAPIAYRLQAAKAAQEKGYQLAFHFDPLVYHEGWQENYSELLEQLFSTVDPQAIRWISLGAFRYSPSFKEVLRLREPQEHLTTQEMLMSHDGKMRYFFPIRTQMYKFMQEKILSYNSSLFVYLCMETKDAWQRVLGYQPAGEATLDKMFEKRRCQIQVS